LPHTTSGPDKSGDKPGEGRSSKQGRPIMTAETEGGALRAVHPPRSAPGDTALHAFECCAQAGVLDLAEVGAGCGGAGFGGHHVPRARLARLRADRNLDNAQLGDRAIAEIGVDTLDDLGALVLNVERAGGTHLQDERGTGAAAFLDGKIAGIPGRTWPFQTLRLGMSAELGTDDRGPVGEQRGGRKAELLHRLLGQLGHIGADRAGERALSERDVSAASDLRCWRCVQRGWTRLRVPAMVRHV